MGYKRVLEENHNKAEKQTSKQMTCKVTKYNINRKIIIIIENKYHYSTDSNNSIQFNSILYYLCAESTATRPITDTAQYRYT
jgi:hypothetical protein